MIAATCTATGFEPPGSSAEKDEAVRHAPERRSEGVLPDVSRTDAAPRPGPLAWVGMQGIDLPVRLAEAGCPHVLHARAGIQVDLPAPHVKGIHMSRLYRLLDTLADEHAVSPPALRHLLLAMIASHHDCRSRNARLQLAFELLVRRPALVTQGLGGWKSYPVRLEAAHIDGVFALRLAVTVVYASTCPCSAALSRQLIEQGFLQAFGQQDSVDPASVAAWLQRNATLATPHSQRSEAQIEVTVTGDSPTLGLLRLIDRIEQAVGTPLQTAVKRADEQAFAALNGQNLMYVEDAARRIETALGGYTGANVHVRHLESLHPHDAVAWAGPAHTGAAG